MIEQHNKKHYVIKKNLSDISAHLNHILFFCVSGVCCPTAYFVNFFWNMAKMATHIDCFDSGRMKHFLKQFFGSTMDF